jgi:hypothetical protein
MFMFQDQHAGQNHNITKGNKFFERVEQLKYLVTTLTYQNSIHKDIKRIPHSGNVCYHSVQNFCLRIHYPYLKIKMYRGIILPVVLYGCETWLFTVGEESRLRVFEKRELRRIFGIKGDEVTGTWVRLYNEELNDLYSSPNMIWVIKSRRMSWMGHVACMGDRRSAYRVLVGRAEGRRPL